MDKYDKAIEHLVDNADNGITLGYANPIEAAWDDPGAPGHELFQYVTADGECFGHCGCLTQIRRTENPLDAWTPELTAAIRADERIPMNVEGIAKLRGDELADALEPFAEWQRRLDHEIRGQRAAV